MSPLQIQSRCLHLVTRQLQISRLMSMVCHWKYFTHYQECQLANLILNYKEIYISSMSSAVSFFIFSVPSEPLHFKEILQNITIYKCLTLSRQPQRNTVDDRMTEKEGNQLVSWEKYTHPCVLIGWCINIRPRLKWRSWNDPSLLVHWAVLQ